MNNIVSIFGYKFSDVAERRKSYDFLEDFISNSHTDWNTTPNTQKIVDDLLKIIRTFSLQEFAFLILHSGFIPENYEADSSEETLYSKLVETLVLEWARRIGFTQSKLPSQKASMEDVSIIDEKHVIVCDVKSFRLGRSQGAPNVKDVLKHADIEKWLSAHTDKEQLGGLVTLPSQHDWKKGSDYYQYTTDKSSPTVSFYYEHLTYFLVSGMDSKDLIKLYESYPDIFPNKIPKSQNNRSKYYNSLHEFLFDQRSTKWTDFNETAQKIISEKVYHCSHTLTNHIDEIRDEIEKKYSTENDIEVLREKAIQAEYEKATDDLNKQKDRIRRFRTSSDGYHEK